MACCPKDALGKLGTEGYQDKGIVEKVDDLDIYFVGNAPKCIIWNYDIFGFNSGRTRQTADLFAEAGYMVIIPDFYRGTWKSPFPFDESVFKFAKEQTDWNKLQADLDTVLTVARGRGASQ